MCKVCEDSSQLNLHCSNCGSSDVVITKEKYFLKNDLGLTYAVSVYQCKNCEEKYLICPECSGTGFISKMLDMSDCNDCDICYGMGVIKLSNFCKK